MDAIKGFDSAVFYLLNTRLTTFILDFLMPFITEWKNYFIVLLFLWAILMIFGTPKTRWTLFLLLVVVAVSDFFSSFILKEYFERLRPCAELEGLRLLVGCSSFLFLSVHSQYRHLCGYGLAHPSLPPSHGALLDRRRPYCLFPRLCGRPLSSGHSRRCISGYSGCAPRFRH